MVRAKLSRFYGWTHSEIMNLTIENAEAYVKCIGYIEAHEKLIDIEAHQFPNYEPKRQKTILKELNKKAYPDLEEVVKAVSTKDIFEKMKRAQNGR